MCYDPHSFRTRNSRHHASKWKRWGNEKLIHGLQSKERQKANRLCSKGNTVDWFWSGILLFAHLSMHPSIPLFSIHYVIDTKLRKKHHSVTWEARIGGGKTLRQESNFEAKQICFQIIKPLLQHHVNNHRKLTKMITWITVLCNSMKLWAMSCRAIHRTDRSWWRVDKTWSTGEGKWKTTSEVLPWTRILNSMKRQKDMTLEDEPPRSTDVKYVTGQEWRSNSRENEEAEPKEMMPSWGCAWWWK